MFRSVSWLFLAVILCLGCSMGANRILKLTNQGEIQFLEQSGNGTNKLSLKASDAMSGDVTLKLPDADGSNGQFLKTNGSGQLSFDNGTSTLQSAYDNGRNISGSNELLWTVTSIGQIMTLKQGGSGSGLIIDNDGNGIGLKVESGSGNAIDITSTGSAKDINGNSSNWYILNNGAIKPRSVADDTARSSLSLGSGDKGAMIWNETDNFPNFWDGTGWRDAAGNST